MYVDGLWKPRGGVVVWTGRLHILGKTNKNSSSLHDIPSYIYQTAVNTFIDATTKFEPPEVLQPSQTLNMHI